MPRWSRRTHSSGVVGSTSTSRVPPFTFSVICMVAPMSTWPNRSAHRGVTLRSAGCDGVLSVRIGRLGAVRKPDLHGRVEGLAIFRGRHPGVTPKRGIEGRFRIEADLQCDLDHGLVGRDGQGLLRAVDTMAIDEVVEVAAQVLVDDLGHVVRIFLDLLAEAAQGQAAIPKALQAVHRVAQLALNSHARGAVE